MTQCRLHPILHADNLSDIELNSNPKNKEGGKISHKVTSWETNEEDDGLITKNPNPSNIHKEEAGRIEKINESNDSDLINKSKSSEVKNVPKRTKQEVEKELEELIKSRKKNGRAWLFDDLFSHSFVIKIDIKTCYIIWP